MFIYKGPQKALMVCRDQDKTRAKTESNFWYLMRNALDVGYGSNYKWRKVRPNTHADARYGLTGMPYALIGSMRGKDLVMIYDPDYAIRSPHTGYNQGATIRLEIMDI